MINYCMLSCAHALYPFRILYGNPNNKKQLYLGNKMERIIKVGMVYVHMNIHLSRCLKEEVAWVIDKWLQANSNKMLF